jgi:hypothetical protein
MSPQQAQAMAETCIHIDPDDWLEYNGKPPISVNPRSSYQLFDNWQQTDGCPTLPAHLLGRPTSYGTLGVSAPRPCCGGGVLGDISDVSATVEELRVLMTSLDAYYCACTADMWVYICIEMKMGSLVVLHAFWGAGAGSSASCRLSLLPLTYGFFGGCIRLCSGGCLVVLHPFRGAGAGLCAPYSFCIA